MATLINPDALGMATLDYLMTRDPIYLHKAKGLIEQELNSPSLQATFLTLDRLELSQVDDTVTQFGFLKLPVSEATNKRIVDGKAVHDPETCEIEENKLIRVYPADSPEISLQTGEGSVTMALIFVVASYDGRTIILTSPPAPKTG